MGKSSHFVGQPMYGQVIKLLDKSKILQISREKGGERYTKRFNGWIHLVVMLYAVIMRFDSLREITASLLTDARKLSHLGITSRLAVVPWQMPTNDVLKLYLRQYTVICMQLIVMHFLRTAGQERHPSG